MRTYIFGCPPPILSADVSFWLTHYALLCADFYYGWPLNNFAELEYETSLNNSANVKGKKQWIFRNLMSLFVKKKKLEKLCKKPKFWIVTAETRKLNWILEDLDYVSEFIIDLLSLSVRIWRNVSIYLRLIIIACKEGFWKITIAWN